MLAPELRRDPISGRMVLIAGHRAGRPQEFVAAPVARRLLSCPFCEGHEGDTPPALATYLYPAGQANEHPWQVRVVPNKYPAVQVDAPDAYGRHEVVIESPHHAASLTELDRSHVETVFRAYHDRMQSMRDDRGIAAALVFKNSGHEAGASLEHLHSQIIGLPIVPPELAAEIAGSRQYTEEHRSCPWCDMIAEAERDGTLLIDASEHFIALAPFAARFAYEFWILPRVHASHFHDASPAQLAELAQFTRHQLVRLERALDHPAYNFYIHTAPFDSGPYDHYHWHIEIFPRTSKAAGFEWGTGMYINPVPPEQAAEQLREVNLDQTANDEMI